MEEKLKISASEENVMEECVFKITELPGFLGFEKIKDFIIEERKKKNGKRKRTG